MEKKHISKHRRSCHGCIHNTAGVANVGPAISKGSVEYKRVCDKCYMWDSFDSIRTQYEPGPGNTDADPMRSVW